MWGSAVEWRREGVERVGGLFIQLWAADHRLAYFAYLGCFFVIQRRVPDLGAPGERR